MLKRRQQPWRHAYQTAYSPVRALLLCLPLGAAILPFLFRLREKIRFPLHAFALTILLLLGIAWYEPSS